MLLIIRALTKMYGLLRHSLSIIFKVEELTIHSFQLLHTDSKYFKSHIIFPPILNPQA